MASERHDKSRERNLDVVEFSQSGVIIDRLVKVAVVPLVGTTIKAATMGWTNPEVGDIIIGRVEIDVTTIATGAGTISAGTTATSLATASQNLIDTLDAHSAAGIFDNVTDKGTLGKSRQRIAAGKFVTFSNQSGDLTGMIATAYVHYHNA